MSDSDDAIGWIGLGALGLPLAVRAVRAGWRVCAFEVDEQRAHEASSAGVEIVAGPGDVGRRAARVVVSVVRTSDQLDVALLGADGALTGSRSLVGVVLSSIGAEDMRALAARAEQRGQMLVGAPVLGNPTAAQAGDAMILLSGPAEGRATAHAVLGSLAKRVIDLGDDVAAAQGMKTISQLLQIVGMMATFEAMDVARHHGIAESVVLDVVGATEPTWATENWDYASDLWRRADPSTSLGLFRKDLAAAWTDAQLAGVPAPVLEAALRRITAHLEQSSEA